MKNTIENKTKFFALYLGQEIAYQKDNQTKFDLDWRILSEEFDSLTNYYIKLKPYTELSKEDANKLVFHLGTVIDLNQIIQEPSHKLLVEILNNYSRVGILSKLPTGLADEMRLLGYAYPWNDISIEEMIEWEWIDLEDNGFTAMAYKDDFGNWRVTDSNEVFSTWEEMAKKYPELADEND